MNSAGAGDTFNGALAARIAEGIGLRESVRYAAAASALAVSRDGVVAAIPKKWEVEQFLREWEGITVEAVIPFLYSGERHWSR